MSRGNGRAGRMYLSGRAGEWAGFMAVNSRVDIFLGGRFWPSHSDAGIWGRILSVCAELIRRGNVSLMVD